MNKDGLLALHNYNAHANALIFEIAAKLSDGQFSQQSSPSHDSVQKLLIHMLESEAFFLSVCVGNPLDELPTLFTLAEIQQAWDALASERQEYLSGLNDSNLKEKIVITIKNQPIRLQKWQALVQGFIHSVHHRGELSVVLTELGHPVPTLDILLDFVKQSGQSWPLG